MARLAQVLGLVFQALVALSAASHRRMGKSMGCVYIISLSFSPLHFWFSFLSNPACRCAFLDFRLCFSNVYHHVDCFGCRLCFDTSLELAGFDLDSFLEHGM